MVSDVAAKGRQGIVGAFAAHRVACNLLMAVLVLAGSFALHKLGTQFFPTFAINFANIQVSWPGAAAEDVAAAITAPLERELRGLGDLREMTSTSSQSNAEIALEYEEDTDLGEAVDQVKERVASIRDLPATAEEPRIAQVINYEPVARLLVAARHRGVDLRPIVREIESDLLERGISQITITGLPEEEIAIQIPAAVLYELDISLREVAGRIANSSRDLPAGDIGELDVSRTLRALEQRRRESEFEDLALLSDDEGRLLTVGDVATVERRARAGSHLVRYRGLPAVSLLLSRSPDSDSLASARIVGKWMEEHKGTWPPAIEVILYDQVWHLLRERIMLLLENGLGGMVLVVSILLFFLNARIAFWVAVGVPVSFMGALAALHILGGSVNMVSLFALIMALGIIVDDAIVVGEDALAQHQSGAGPLAAARGGAERMIAPVLASSLTTIAAFLPLMLVSGIIGRILFDIPLVVICVITASLIECFLILPGHLRQAISATARRPAPSRTRQRLDAAFAYFRERVFRPAAVYAVRQPFTVLSAMIGVLALAIGLLAGGHVAFNFFPTPESTTLSANVTFVAGTPANRVRRFVTHLEQTLRETEVQLGGGLVKVAVAHLGAMPATDNQPATRGDQLGSLVVELIAPDDRTVRNTQLIETWRERTVLPPGLEAFSIQEQRPGPPGRDIAVRLKGSDPTRLKAAALELAGILRTIPGVGGVQDDLPYGKEQLVYRLTAQGQVLGLSIEDVGSQLRAAYEGRIAQIFQHEGEEIEVRVILPERERSHLGSLADFNVTLPGGGSAPLLSVVDITPRRGFDKLRRYDGRLSVEVSADVDAARGNSNRIIAALGEGPLPKLAQRHGVSYSFEGRRADQRQTLSDMAWGAGLALALIYIVLAFVFASYGWPLVVMAVIPFALVGAIAGHMLLGLDLTILSLFGLFGLSGIVVNGSIVLVMFYKDLKESGIPWREAIVEAACLRLRAVLLTSLTTIGGLTPLMFETSLQAQFLIPMAVSISFGLAFATLLVLLALPALLCMHESVVVAWQRDGAGRAPAPRTAL